MRAVRLGPPAQGRARRRQHFGEGQTCAPSGSARRGYTDRYALATRTAEAPRRRPRPDPRFTGPIRSVFSASASARRSALRQPPTANRRGVCL